MPALPAGDKVVGQLRFTKRPTPPHHRVKSSHAQPQHEEQNLDSSQDFSPPRPGSIPVLSFSPKPAYATRPNSMFPSTRSCLWDRTCQGARVPVSVADIIPDIYLQRPALRTLYSYICQRTESSQQANLPITLLVGNVCDNGHRHGQACTLMLNWFDCGMKTSPFASVRTIPKPSVDAEDQICLPVYAMNVDAHEPVVAPKTDYIEILEELHRHWKSPDQLSIPDLLGLHLRCAVRPGEKALSISVEAIVPRYQLFLSPISPLRVQWTPLTQILYETNPKDREKSPQSGFLSLDQSRKIVVLLASDPKTYEHPLVGVWVSGVPRPDSALVWGACLRFLHCRSIQERALMGGSDATAGAGFLILAYQSDCQPPRIYEGTWEHTPAVATPEDAAQVAASAGEVILYDYRSKHPVAGEISALSPGHALRSFKRPGHDSHDSPDPAHEDTFLDAACDDVVDRSRAVLSSPLHVRLHASTCTEAVSSLKAAAQPSFGYEEDLCLHPSSRYGRHAGEEPPAEKASKTSTLRHSVTFEDTQCDAVDRRSEGEEEWIASSHGRGEGDSDHEITAATLASLRETADTDAYARPIRPVPHPAPQRTPDSPTSIPHAHTQRPRLRHTDGGVGISRPVTTSVSHPTDQTSSGPMGSMPPTTTRAGSRVRSVLERGLGANAGCDDRGMAALTRSYPGFRSGDLRKESAKLRTSLAGLE
eukprot:Rmarinus@m.2663